jgi:hypothetical protein
LRKPEEGEGCRLFEADGLRVWVTPACLEGSGKAGLEFYFGRFGMCVVRLLE